MHPHREYQSPQVQSVKDCTHRVLSSDFDVWMGKRSSAHLTQCPAMHLSGSDHFELLQSCTGVTCALERLQTALVYGPHDLDLAEKA
mmetsp:Transcript_57878/g.102684  ORF Transcript_57878/g.102684 Transcript_57878/m.102684 type:complete len:87 (+) Transcript_57878:718-978(+)